MLQKSQKSFTRQSFSKKNLGGFTIIELLVVIAIISLLASIIVVSIIGAQIQARDVKRKVELDQIRTALEFYYNNENKYPTTAGWISLEGDDDTHGPFSQAMKPGYLSAIPRDPLYKPGGDYSYKYTATTTDSYQLYAKREGGGFFIISSELGTIAYSAESPDWRIGRFWVGGTGNWSDTSHWSAGSGGSGGASKPTSSDNVYFDINSGGGTVTVNETANCKDLDFTGYTGTFAGSSTLNIYGSLTMAAGMTRTYSGVIYFQATSGTKTITSNGISFYYLVFAGSGGTTQLVDTLTIAYALNKGAGAFNANGQTVIMNATGVNDIFGSFTFYNLTRTGSVTKTANLRIQSANQTITGTLTLNGNSATNRLLVQSSTIGTARTLTAATVSVSNADFQDITGAGAGNWNLSGVTGGSGDAGGNSGITFTTAVTQYWFSNTGSWSNSAKWFLATNGGGGAGRVPLPQDDVVFDINSFSLATQTVTADMPRLGKNINWTGATNTPTLSFSTTNSIYGSLTAIAAMTISGTYGTTFAGRSSYTLTSNGKTFTQAITLDAPGGTLTLQDNMSLASARTLTVTRGTFNANNNNISTGLLTMGAGGTLTLGSATHLLTGTGTVFTGAGTLNANTSTLKITDTSITAITFAGGGKTYNNLWFFRGASTGNITISGSNTFADFKDNGSATHSILFTAGTTQTVTTFTVSGTAGNLITINSTTIATHALVKSGGGTISSDYLNIQHSVATPATTWYAGVNSVNNQAVATAGSGWTFAAPP